MRMVGFSLDSLGATLEISVGFKENSYSSSRRCIACSNLTEPQALFKEVMSSFR
jgi:hypothetical protein